MEMTEQASLSLYSCRLACYQSLGWAFHLEKSYVTIKAMWLAGNFSFLLLQDTASGQVKVIEAAQTSMEVAEGQKGRVNRH